MGRKGKLGGVRGVRDWQNLATAGDVRRFLRWLILSMRDNTLEAKDAAVMGQLGSYLLKCLEVSDFEERLARIERALQGAEVADGDPGSTTLPN